MIPDSETQGRLRRKQAEQRSTVHTGLNLFSLGDWTMMYLVLVMI